MVYYTVTMVLCSVASAIQKILEIRGGNLHASQETNGIYFLLHY